MLPMIDQFSLTRLTPHNIAKMVALLCMGALISPLAHGQNVELPKINIPPQSFAPDNKPTTSQPLLTEARSVNLNASLVEDGEPIAAGLHWRIFGADMTSDGVLPLIAEFEGGSAAFVLSEGTYFAHVAFGQAGATRKFTIGEEDYAETLALNAGGLVLNGSLPNGAIINEDTLTFSIYELEEDATGNRPLVASGVKAGDIVRLKAETYHVVSEYGDVNARIRADILVDAGRITEATIEHRAARLAFKLVRMAGGQALLGTQWSIYNESGDLLQREASPYASIILAEGNYTVVAQNRDRVFEEPVAVIAGENQDIEVLATNPTN